MVISYFLNYIFIIAKVNLTFRKVPEGPPSRMPAKKVNLCLHSKSTSELIYVVYKTHICRLS